MTGQKNTLVVLGVVAAVAIGVAYLFGYLVGINSYPGYSMMGTWPGIAGWGALPNSMMNRQIWPGGWVAGMMGSGMMGPGMMRQSLGGPWQNTVLITNYSFYPDTLTVPKGSTITWVNMDHVAHTVEAGTHEKPTGAFESELMAHMGSFSHTFNETGVHVYHCDPHPYMAGRIIVEG